VVKIPWSLYRPSVVCETCRFLNSSLVSHHTHPHSRVLSLALAFLLYIKQQIRAENNVWSGMRLQLRRRAVATDPGDSVSWALGILISGSAIVHCRRWDTIVRRLCLSPLNKDCLHIPCGSGGVREGARTIGGDIPTVSAVKPPWVGGFFFLYCWWTAHAYLCRRFRRDSIPFISLIKETLFFHCSKSNEISLKRCISFHIHCSNVEKWVTFHFISIHLYTETLHFISFHFISLWNEY
jgi:hypothetical protein